MAQGAAAGGSVAAGGVTAAGVAVAVPRVAGAVVPQVAAAQAAAQRRAAARAKARAEARARAELLRTHTMMAEAEARSEQAAAMRRLTADVLTPAGWVPVATTEANDRSVAWTGGLVALLALAGLLLAAFRHRRKDDGRGRSVAPAPPVEPLGGLPCAIEAELQEILAEEAAARTRSPEVVT